LRLTALPTPYVTYLTGMPELKINVTVIRPRMFQRSFS